MPKTRRKKNNLLSTRIPESLKEWLAQPRHQKNLALFLRSETGHALMAVLDEQTPMVLRVALDPVFAHVELGRINERIIIRRLIRAMAVPHKPDAPIEEVLADYSTPPVPDHKKP